MVCHLFVRRGMSRRRAAWQADSHEYRSLGGQVSGWTKTKCQRRNSSIRKSYHDCHALVVQSTGQAFDEHTDSSAESWHTAPAPAKAFLCTLLAQQNMPASDERAELSIISQTWRWCRQCVTNERSSRSWAGGHGLKAFESSWVGL